MARIIHERGPVILPAEELEMSMARTGDQDTDTEPVGPEDDGEGERE